LRGFLGLAGYYRKFIKHFGLIAKPLTDLLCKDSIFIWTSIHEAAFSALKSALSSAPVLSIPDFSIPFHLETNASGSGVGAVLLQNGHRLAYISKALGPRNQGLSVYEKEYLAILMAVDQWRHYLMNSEYIIHTDHHSLIHLNEQRLHTPWQQKVFSKLLGLRYKVVYRKGSENQAADAPSRRDHPQQLHAISSPAHLWLDQLRLWYPTAPEAKALLSQLLLDSSSHPPYRLKDGVIFYKDRIWLGSNSDLRQKVMSALHNSPVGGHSGAPATFSKLRPLFYWPGMRKDVLTHVQSCTVCAQAKPDRVGYPGLLQPLQVPRQSWEVISLDFVEGLPLSNSFSVILVVVDKFSKFAHFIALKHPYSAASVAQVFLDNIYKLHGLPVAIIPDRDRVFTSKFWQLLFQLAGTELQMSTAYHPQSDGQTERVNQCMETYLRCFVQACPRRWSRWLSLAEYWYNTSPHSAFGRTPFEVLGNTSPQSNTSF
jgi:transposase InsO family protein